MFKIKHIKSLFFVLGFIGVVCGVVWTMDTLITWSVGINYDGIVVSIDEVLQYQGVNKTKYTYIYEIFLDNGEIITHTQEWSDKSWWKIDEEVFVVFYHGQYWINFDPRMFGF